MAQISPMRVKVSVDDNTLRIAALNAAIASMGPYCFMQGIDPGSNDDWYVDAVEARTNRFLALLQDGQPQTLGSEDDTTTPGT